MLWNWRWRCCNISTVVLRRNNCTRAWNRWRVSRRSAARRCRSSYKWLDPNRTNSGELPRGSMSRSIKLTRSCAKYLATVRLSKLLYSRREIKIGRACATFKMDFYLKILDARQLHYCNIIINYCCHFINIIIIIIWYVTIIIYYATQRGAAFFNLLFTFLFNDALFLLIKNSSLRRFAVLDIIQMGIKCVVCGAVYTKEISLDIFFFLNNKRLKFHVN